MRWIATVFFTALCAFASAQKLSSALSPSDGGDLFMEATQADLVKRFGTDAVDSIRTMKMGDRYFIRRMSGDGVWNIKSLGIQKDGSPARNSYLLRKALNMDYVQEIVVSDDDPGVFYFSQNINFKGKRLVFKQGCYIDGSKPISIDSAFINGDFNSKLFGVNINLINVKTIDKYFSVNWLGLIGDGVTVNDRAVVRKFKDLHKQNFLLVNCPGYVIDTTFFIHRDNNIDMTSAPLMPNFLDKTGFQIGDSLLNYRPYGGDWKIRVMNTTFAPILNNENSIGVLIVNAESVQNANIIFVNGFYNAVVFRGDNNAFVGNTIFVTKTNNSINHIVLQNKGDGWVNGNNFFIGHCRNQSGFNLNKSPVGILIGDPTQKWVCQGNKFWGGTYELNNPNGRVCYIKYGMSNRLNLDYMEANGKVALYVGKHVQNAFNEVFLGHTSSVSDELVSDSSVLGMNELSSMRSEPYRRNTMIPLLNIPDITQVVTMFNQQGNALAIGGGLNPSMSYVQGRPVDSIAGGFIENGYLVIPKIGVGLSSGIINTENVKKFYIRREFAKGYAGEIRIKLMDGNGEVLDTSLFKLQSPDVPNYYHYFGGSWGIGGSPSDYFNGDTYFKVPEACKKIQIFFQAGAKALKLRAINISAFDFGVPSIVYPNGKEIKARVKPYAGSYSEGVVVQDINPANKRLWICIRRGTARTKPLSANLTYVNNSNKVKSNIPVDSIPVGTWLMFGDNGSPRMVIGKKNGDTLVLDGSLTGNGKAVPINIPAPQWLEVSENSNNNATTGNSKGTVKSSDLNNPNAFGNGNWQTGLTESVLNRNAALINNEDDEVNRNSVVSNESLNKSANISSNYYLPQLTNSTNIVSDTINYASILHVDRSVFIRGNVYVTASSTGAVYFSLSLPPGLTSDFTKLDQVNGSYTISFLGANVAIVSPSNNSFFFSFNGTEGKTYFIQYDFQYFLSKP